MTNKEFRQWLSGFFELSSEEDMLDLGQLQIIVNHLNLAEAVEGKLDEVNQRLRDDILAFRQRPNPQPEDFDGFTLDMRERVLSAAAQDAQLS